MDPAETAPLSVVADWHSPPPWAPEFLDDPPTWSAGSPPQARRPLPLRAGLLVVAGFGAALAISAVVLRIGEPSRPLVTALAVIVLQYAAMFGLCVTVSRRWGTSSLREDLGLRFRRRDTIDGVVGWLAGLGVVAALGSLLERAGVPLASNNPFSDPSRDSLSLPQWAAVAVVGLVMVVLAPFFEELLFRGVLMRSLSSATPPAVAIGIQGLVFGAFHVQPTRGMGNVGLLAVLSGLGCVLGWISHRREGRLGGSIVAHMLHNTLAFSVGIAALL